TVPVAVPLPGSTGITVAKKVTAWPAAAGLTDDPRTTEVDARLTVTPTAAELLPVKPPMPAKEAVTAWLPTPSDTSILAWPWAPASAWPGRGVGAGKVTEPLGVPAGEVTVAVSISLCPVTAVVREEVSVVVVAAASRVEVFNRTRTSLEKVLATARS